MGRPRREDDRRTGRRSRAPIPAKSNSGFTLSQLELIIAATKSPYDSPTVAEAKRALPTVRRLYDAQGLQAKSSDFGFDQWLLQGGELHQPLYAGYESQIIGKTVEYGSDDSALKQLQSSVRILYPEPTIYADHPILALDAPARQLIEAMKDPEIQKIAWERYGFRSGVLARNRHRVLQAARARRQAQRHVAAERRRDAVAPALHPGRRLQMTAPTRESERWKQAR